MHTPTDVPISSVLRTRKTVSVIEKTMETLFFLCGGTAVLAVAAISIYMTISGFPVFAKIGVADFLFSPLWAPNADEFGILRIILTSLTGTFLAVLTGVPAGLLTAVFLAELAPKPIYKLLRPAVELLAGIPSVIYGFLGLTILVPLIAELELLIFEGSQTHQFTGGANLLSAVVVLAIMILPTVINVSETSLRADEEDMRHLFSNLIDNAIKYTDPGGRVTVRIAYENAVPSFSVEDNGIGIPAKDIPRVFERFYRVDKGRSRMVGGTGLGLSIVKHVVARYNGELQIQSKVGEGTRLCVTFPRTT